MSHTKQTGACFLVPLTAAGCLLLASCEASFEDEDRAFSRATQQRLSGEFQKQVALLSEAEKHLPAAGTDGEKVPGGFSPWWNEQAAAKLFEGSEASSQALDDLFARALKHSSQIKVFSDVPLIRETGIREARGEFDTHLFTEGHYSFGNEPVGTLLDTGRTGRYRKWETYLEAGVKKKLVTGADVKVSQEFLRINDNSLFRDPNPQAYAKLGLVIIQPLLRRAGVKYNRSWIRIAKLDSEIARNEFVRQTESHLLAIVRAYWNLHLTRSVCIQKRKLLADTAAVVARLEKRKDLDAIEGELMQARAAVARRRADLVRAEMGIKNAEDRIRALVNDPELLKSTKVELVPNHAPAFAELQVNMKDAAATALENRPEIAQAFLQLKAAAIRRNVAKNELLPQLDLILETAIAGLDRAGRLTDGYDEQWDAHPGFLVGFKFDFPAENNAAEARYLRRRLEMRQQLAQLQTTVDTVLLEVKISARELATSYREMNSRYESLQAAQEDLRILNKRWASHAGAANKPAIGYLQLLLEAQQRQAEAEEDFARASTLYNVAMVNLQRAQGTLLQYKDLQVTEDEDERGLPLLKLSKTEAEAKATN